MGGFENMKNLKKFLAVLLVVAVMATMLVPVFANSAISAEAKLLADLGVLKGDGSGVNVVYLAKGTTRVQAAILYLRLIGKEDEALNYTGPEKFADQNDYSWVQGRNILSYLKANPSLGWDGFSDGTFRPYDDITAQMFYKVMLESLGFKKDSDFKWSEVISFAKSKGLSKIANVLNMTNNDVATALVETLSTNTKDGKLMVKKLIDEGVIKNAERAIELFPLEVKSVSVSSADKIKVEFNKPVANKTAAKFDLKVGFLSQDVSIEWSDDSKVVFIKNQNGNYAQGGYVLNIEDLGLAKKSYDVEVKAQTIQSFRIKTEMLTAVASQDLIYEAIDQYGNPFEVASINFTATAYNASAGSPVTITGSGNKFVVSGLTSANKDHNIIVTLVHTSTGKTVTSTFKVMAASQADSVTLAAPSPKSGTQRIEKNDTSNALILPITVKDQYGKDIKLTAYPINGVQIISSNSSIVDPANCTINADGKLTFQTGSSSGTVTITAIVTATGKSSTVSFQVFEPASLKSFTLQQPTALIVAGEKFEVAYSAVDTFGAQIKLKPTDPISWVTTQPSIVEGTDITIGSDGKLTIQPKATGSGMVTIMAFYQGIKQGEISLDVKAKAVVSKIQAVKPSAIVTFNKNGGTYQYTRSDFEFRDQYNRVMKDSAIDNTKIAVTVKDSSTNFVTASGSTVTAANNKVGTKVLTVTYDSTVSRDFTVTVVDEGSVVGYEVNAISNTKLYSNNWANETAAGDYARRFQISYGLTAAGDKVALSTADKADYIIISSNSDEVIATTTGYVYAKNQSDGKTAVVTLWKKGIKVAEVTFTTSKAAPALTTLSFKEAEKTLALSGTLDANTNIDKKLDQYGVAVSSMTGTWYSTNPTVAIVDSSTGIITASSSNKGETTITFVSTNGVYASFKVKVQ
jgi:hypothetical protein